MGRVRITMDIDPEHADENDDSGMTEESYEKIIDALNGFGDDIDITKED